MDQRLESFGEFIEETMQDWDVPGLAVLVVKDGEVILSRGYGMRDVDGKLPVTSDTLFAIASCTKAFTAVSAGILVDEGKLNWDTPVRHYLPDFRMYDPYVTEHMTMRDLLTHRSGLPRYDTMWSLSTLNRRELYERLRYLEPGKGFRSAYQYQNLMYMTAGYLMGQIVGTNWEDFLQKRILDPLGMGNTNFSVTESQKALDFALPHYAGSDKVVKNIPFKNIDAMAPAGSINSNLKDMAQWLLFNLNKGKWDQEQIISEDSLSQIQSPQIVTPDPIKYAEILHASYGMGWLIIPYRGHNMLAHRGGIDGFSTIVILVPSENIGVAVFANKSDTPVPVIVARDGCDRLLGLSEIPWSQRFRTERDEMEKGQAEAKREAEKRRKTGTQPSHPLEDYEGDFQHPAYGTLSVKKDGDGLTATYYFTSTPLEHYHYDTFSVQAENMVWKITFSTDANGNVVSLSIPIEAGVNDIVFGRQEPFQIRS